MAQGEPALGGHRRFRLYGRFDCPGSLRAMAQGLGADTWVPFADEASAAAAGYRPCGRCTELCWK
jgi:hypothetical protein